MTNNKKQVVWEKWVDPMNSNIDEVEFPGYNLPSMDGAERETDYLAPMDSEYSGELPFDPDEFHAADRQRVVNTQFGFMTLTEHSYASKHFDFWTVHCNFPITELVAEAIEDAPGVESINVLTRYRARLGFNRPLLESGAFNLTEIRLGVERAALALDNKENVLDDTKKLLLFNDDVRRQVQETIKKLSEENMWILYLMPNGQMETYSEQTDEASEKMIDKLLLFNKTRNLIGGSVFTSEEN